MHAPQGIPLCIGHFPMEQRNVEVQKKKKVAMAMAMAELRLWAAIVSRTSPLRPSLTRSRPLSTASHHKPTTTTNANANAIDDIPAASGASQIASRGWQITSEVDSDWRSHAAAVARSVDLIKSRLQVRVLCFGRNRSLLRFVAFRSQSAN